MTGAPSRVIDLDQLRAEANRQPVSLVVGGATFELPAVMPVALSIQVSKLASATLDADTAEAVFRTIVVGLVGDRADELMGALSLEELQHVVTTAYGVTVGESSDLVASSPNGGTRPSPTLPVSTEPS